MITLDTSGILALLNRADPDHERTREALLADPGPYVVPAGIMAEVAFLAERKGGPQVLDGFLADLSEGRYLLDCGEDDLPRIRELVRRYADLPLGFADAAVAVCAERSGGLVLTLDVRDFGVVAKEGRIRVLPEPA